MPSGKSDALAVLDDELRLDLPPRPKVLDIANAFQKLFGKAIDYRKSNPQDNARLVSALVQEIQRAVDLHPEAKGWYDENVKLTMDVMRELDPDIAKPENDFIFKAILAATSDGNKVGPQFEQTWKEYSNWKNTGEISGKFVSGDRIENIQTNLSMINQMVKSVGWEATKDFFTRKGTVKEVRKALMDVFGWTKKEAQGIGSSELADEVVPFAVVLGPKLGSFFNNLYGDFSSVTMDRWFMRTIGRLTGSQVNPLTGSKIREMRSNLRGALDALTPSQFEMLGIKRGDLKGTGIDSSATTIAGRFSKKALRDTAKQLSEAGQPALEQTRKFANALKKGLNPLVEAPVDGTHRRWIRQRIAEVQDQLRSKGIELENADLQAVLWYLEKELYEKLKYRSKSGESDYASAASSLYESVVGRPSELYAAGTGRVRAIGSTGRSEVVGPADAGQAARQEVGASRFMPDQQGFYSKLEEVIANKLPNLATPQQVLATVDPAKGSGVKAEELKWTEFAKTVQQLADQNNGKVPKDKLLKMINWLGKEMFREQTFSDENHVRRYVVNDPFSSSTYDNLTDAEEARGVAVDFLRSDMEREWQIDEWEDGTFKITNNYGEPLRIQRDESGREIWAPDRSYPTREEAEAALSKGAQTVADALVRVDEQKEATDGPEFEVWSLPGGEKYREVALVAPYVGAWKDRPTGHDLGRNADADVNTARVAHMRLKDRVDTAGRPGTFIEEIQSDRHQAGREKGYAENPSKQELQELEIAKQHNERAFEALRLALKNDAPEEVVSKLENERNEAKRVFNEIEAEIKAKQSKVPDAPYRKDWGVQMFKRALRDAVRDGKTWIGWTTGETQADRYNLAKKIKLASAIANKDGTYNVVFEDLQGQEVPGYEGSGKKLTAEELGKTVGEELAKKLIEGADRNKDRPWPKGAKINPAFFTLRGMDLKVGGEGMKGFYDQILPSEIGKYVKQWGAKVEKGAITTPETAGQNARLQHELYDPQGNLFDAYETLQDAQNAARDAGPGYFVKSPERSVRTIIWRVDITPQMRESVQKTGQPRFMPQPDPSVPGAYSVTGGFRILPGKTAGRMRVYGPSGSLVGIAGSLDEAQRMIRKKTQSN